MSHIERGLVDAMALINWLRENEQTENTIARFGERLVDCLRSGGRILTCGNGGSMCDAMHFAEELSGRYRKDRRALAAQSISDPGHLTGVANDWGFDRVFARGVEAWARAGDVLVVFSTSGNSPNLIAAAEAARADGIVVMGFLGRGGGALKGMCDQTVIVPGTTADRIQEIHIMIMHLVIEYIERHLFPENYAA